jgi:hypothetical protein
MKRFTKVNVEDVKNIQIGAGVLLNNFDVDNPKFSVDDVICATSGGVNPVCTPEYYDFAEDVDNAKQSKETKRIRGWNASISFNTVTASLNMIRVALGAADVSGKVLSLRQRLQYAKEFNDIWWLGNRMDGVLVAIHLIRALSDSGFSLQTSKGGKGQISVTLKGHSSFAEPNKIPMEVYIFAESDIPIVPDEPDTPTTAMYLYGTPSNGVSYNGTVLPELPEYDESVYPYAYITRISYADETESIDMVGLYLSDTAAYYDAITGVKMIPAWSKVQSHIVENGAFVLYAEEESASLFSPLEYDGNDYYTLIWASEDVKGKDNDTVYFAASEPVHSGNIGLRVGDTVTYYDGAVVVNIGTVYTDEMKAKYPYAMLVTSWKDGSFHKAFLQCYASNAYYTVADSGSLYFGGIADSDLSSEKVAAFASTYTEGAWSSGTEMDDHSTRINEFTSYSTSRTTWSNFKIEYDGTVYCDGSVAIPVGEIVDYINDIPIYEVIKNV